ncbi:hypothetical protein HAX54_002249 [Datura stramonium]|uniref:Uncharacterized protein n=1 Tax=Datura stramonium TaxID=4076 RepID=A0ABS8T3K9_DATST|nr:hypothetical protein [Datura stramonium]
MHWHIGATSRTSQQYIDALPCTWCQASSVAACTKRLQQWHKARCEVPLLLRVGRRDMGQHLRVSRRDVGQLLRVDRGYAGQLLHSGMGNTARVFTRPKLISYFN